MQQLAEFHSLLDILVPPTKTSMIEKAEKEVKVEKQYLEGIITNGERYNKIIEYLVEYK